MQAGQQVLGYMSDFIKISCVTLCMMCVKLKRKCLCCDMLAGLLECVRSAVSVCVMWKGVYNKVLAELGNIYSECEIV